MTDLQRLALTYVSRRHARGEINDRSAEQLRSRLWDFASATAARPANVNRRHVETWLERPGISAAYRRSRLSALRGFCRWCVLQGHMRRDPTIGIKAPPVPKYLPRAVSHDQARAIVAACPDRRTRVIALLMLSEGLRRAEVASVQLGDVNLSRRSIEVRGKGGQGKVTRELPLSDESVSAIERYLAEVGHRSGPLIRSKVIPERGVSPATVGELVKVVMEVAGVKERAGDGRSAHALRHTMAHHVLDTGARMEELQQALGHSSIKNTEVYTRGRVAELRGPMSGRSYT